MNNRKKKKGYTTTGRNSLLLVQSYFPRVGMVVDATKPVIIDVTQQDASNAKVRDPNNCAFALSCCRILKADGAIIGLSTSYIIKGKKALRYKNTEALCREIVSFDRKAGFDLGMYMMSPASPGGRLGVHKGGPGRGDKKNNGIKRFRHWTKNVRVLGVD
jgi:hypothetical protein